MAHSYKAPKQWPLPSDATVNQYEAWKNNLIFTLSLDSVNSHFLKDDTTWQKQKKSVVHRGFTDDPTTVEATKRLTAAQKASALTLMLGQIANYSPINRSTIIKDSTCLKDVWKAIRQHLGFQATGARTLDLADMSLKPGERPEELYQRLLAFMDDNLMKVDGGVKHLNEDITEDEETTPSLENYIVVIWLKILHSDLPKLVKQRYGTELRTNSIASIKGEISGALDSLLEEIHATQDSKVLRSVINNNRRQSQARSSDRSSNKECPLCQQAGRPSINHFLSECHYLPERDRKFVTKSRAMQVDSDDDVGGGDNEDDQREEQLRRLSVEDNPDVSPVARRVPVVDSPFLKCFFKHYAVRVTVDSGATGNYIRLDVVKRMNVNIRKNTQKSHQADGKSSLAVVGEVTITLTFKNHQLILEALVAPDLEDEVLGGSPFMKENDVWVRPKKQIVGIGESTYYYNVNNTRSSSTRRVQAEVMKSPSNVTIWPGDFLQLQVPDQFADEEITVEPRTDCKLNNNCPPSKLWPNPQLLTCAENTIRIPNLTTEPKSIRKGDHFCQIVRTVGVDTQNQPIDTMTKPAVIKEDHSAYRDVVIDPDNITPQEFKQKLECLCESYGHVFSPKLKGYNGRDGSVKAVVNMGPVMPPQRKGRMPLYNKDKLNLLQSKFDELEEQNVIAKPEDVGVIVEYLNPSMLIKKPRGGHRLVTEFGEVAKYAKPQPSLLPDMDSTLRSLAQWKYIICTDLCKAYYQIPLDSASMKYCGVATPFKGTRVYLTAAMGMPGSETALEEVVCRVFGSLIQADQAVKIADNLFCGGNTLEELCVNWEQVLKAASRNDLRLSPSQTIINPKSTTILGWLWSEGTLSATPHSLCTLQTCKTPETVTQLKSFIGAYKILSRVIPDCAKIISPLDSMAAGRPSSEKLTWNDVNLDNFKKAQEHLNKATTITMPRKTDKLWIVLDAATRSPGIGATMYVGDNNKNFKIGGFFSAKLRSNQIDWLPCEREALCIGASVKHFQPFIVQSQHQTTVLTDNKPCVQAFEKAQKGEFSASPRVSTFLSNCHRFQVAVRHIAGAQNMLSDHQSRNPPTCEDASCQICRFIAETEDSVVRAISVQDVISGKVRAPFLTRTTWKSTQLECPDLRRTHAHLTQGTRPSKKQTSIRDVKRYLQKVVVASDGLLIVRNDEVTSTVKERIVVPRSVITGLLTSLHLRLDHPTNHQLKLVARRHFYALDMDSVIDQVSTSCHTCSSLTQLSHMREKQSTSDPPGGVCIQFAADVIRREKQFIFMLRDVVTSYTWSLLIEGETAETLRDSLIRLCVANRPIDGPKAVVRVDPAPGFIALKEDKFLSEHNIILDIGRVKNSNKNPVAERGVEELETELLKQAPAGGPVSHLTLATATARLNARIRTRGLSAREMLFQRDQFTNEQLPLTDMDLITEQHQSKLRNHQYSEKSKAPTKGYRPDAILQVGDLVYLHHDANKLKSRDRYIVTATDNEWVYVRKFSGNQLRNASYKVKRSECFKVPSSLLEVTNPTASLNDDVEDEMQIPVVEDERHSTPNANPPQQQQQIPSETIHHLTHEEEPTVPDVIVPQETPGEGEPLQDTSSRSQRTRKPVDKLTINWNSKTYT